MNAHEKAAHDLLMAAVKEDGQPRDMDAAYREALDEIYSFKSVGGPFACMQPSRVLEECDPTAYRCGFSDWLEQVADALDSEITDLETSIEDLESEVAELEGENPADISEEEIRDREVAGRNSSIDDLTAELEETQAILAAVKAYAF